MKMNSHSSQLPVLQMKGPGSENPGQCLIRGRAVIGQDDRLPAMDVKRRDTEKFRQSLAVGRIFHKTEGGSGTAFRVGPGNCMMTNAHMFTSADARDYLR